MAMSDERPCIKCDLAAECIYKDQPTCATLSAYYASIETALATAQRERDEAQAKLLLIETASEVCGDTEQQAATLARQYRTERDEARRKVEDLNETLLAMDDRADELDEADGALMDFGIPCYGEETHVRVKMLGEQRNALAAQMGQMRGKFEHIKEYWNGAPESAVDAIEHAIDTAIEALSLTPTPHEQEWTAMRDVVEALDQAASEASSYIAERHCSECMERDCDDCSAIKPQRTVALAREKVKQVLSGSITPSDGQTRHPEGVSK
jgi:hypothetical protein